MRHQRFPLLATLCALAAASSLQAATPATAPASSPPTAAELALAHAFDHALHAPDLDAAKKCIDAGAIFDRSLVGIDGAAQLAQVREKTAAGISDSLVNSIEALLHNGNAYEFLRVRTLNGKRTALFRLVGAAGLNYFDWEIVKSPDGSLRFADQYDLAKGDWISGTLHMYFLASGVSAAAANDNPSPFQRDLIDSLPKIQKINSLIQENKQKDALDVYNTLPVSVQQLKPILITRVVITDHLTPQEYDLALADFEKRFPNDASIELLGLDSFISRKDFPRAHLAVERMIAYTGGDSFLHIINGNLYVSSGAPDDLPKAEDSFKKAIAMEVHSPKAYDGLIDLYISEKQFGKAVDMLDLTEKTLHVDLGDLSKEPGYVDLVKTPEYAAWRNAHHAATQPAKP